MKSSGFWLCCSCVSIFCRKTSASAFRSRCSSSQARLIMAKRSSLMHIQVLQNCAHVRMAVQYLASSVQNRTCAQFLHRLVGNTSQTRKSHFVRAARFLQNTENDQKHPLQGFDMPVCQKQDRGDREPCCADDKKHCAAESLKRRSCQY